MRDGGQDALAQAMDRALPIPTAIVKRLAADIYSKTPLFDPATIARLEAALGSQGSQHQVVYLPTYRRIEKELASIFPDLEESLQTFNRKRGTFASEARRPGFRESRRGFVELVEFGMEDVADTFNRARRDLVEMARSELSNLAVGYLRDVIRGDGEKYAASTFSQLDDATINRILNRASEQTLSESDKSRLRAVIEG